MSRIRVLIVVVLLFTFGRVAAQAPTTFSAEQGAAVLDRLGVIMDAHHVLSALCGETVAVSDTPLHRPPGHTLAQAAMEAES